jgi:translation initiation factor IF-3
LDDSGKQIGVIDRNEALRKAQTEEKDLVEIAPNAKPPVVKLIDFKKFKYIEAKRERESRKSIKHVGIKEIRLSPFVGEHDFETRLSRGEKFLKEGNQLKIAIPFRGREITRKEFGMAVIRKAIVRLSHISRTIREPYFEGRVLVTMLAASRETEKVEEKGTVPNAKSQNK